MEVATQEKDELKRMVVEMVDERSALAQRAEDAEQLATARGHTIQGLRYELLEVKVERDALAARLAELEGQEPVAAQCRFKNGIEEWMWCDLAHHRYVQATLSEWAGYETRALFARPVPAEQPVNAKLLRALKELIRDADCSDYGEEGINYPVPSTHLRGASCPICEARDAIADAESQAGPVRLTEAEIGVIDRQSREGIKSLMSTWPVPLARAIEDAVLRANGLKPQTKGD